MSKSVMIQGTMSGAGKSLLCAALCRIFRQDGFRAVPFKSQNMALNSFITREGLEMGRAQVMQAEAAGIEPSVYMNPILLKPTGDTRSQVIVNGEVLAGMTAQDYFVFRKSLIPQIMAAYGKLEESADIIVIEGAGSPAEINLKKDDIVNMGMAALADAPVFLAGDIDRGGVFAQLYGTVGLLEKDERARVKGLIINKFRGDRTILDPGIRMLEDLTQIPVTGVIPYVNVLLDDEDSLTERFSRKGDAAAAVDIAVIRLPRISNFTDLTVFETIPDVSLRYVGRASDLGKPDMIILPGSKNTMGDLKAMRSSGLEAAVLKAREAGSVIFGICGGYQMLCGSISDPDNVEEGGSMRGMGLLPGRTVLQKEKRRTRVTGSFGAVEGVLSALAGKPVEGYEIHMGRTELPEGLGSREGSEEFAEGLGSRGGSEELPGGTSGNLPAGVSGPLVKLRDSVSGEESCDGMCAGGEVYGSYVHGLFDAGDTAVTVARALAARKGTGLRCGPAQDYRAFRESQYDLLADTVREHMDMEAVYESMGMRSRGK